MYTRSRCNGYKFETSKSDKLIIAAGVTFLKTFSAFFGVGLNITIRKSFLMLDAEKHFADNTFPIFDEAVNK